MENEPHGLDDDVVHMHQGCAWGIRHHATVETDADGVGGGDHVPAAFDREAVRNRQGRSHLSAVGGQREGRLPLRCPYRRS